MTNTNESGRSMVEMLGVLAIIGVLSVMGIAGYTQAMKKFRANEAVSEITMGAMLCATGQGVSSMGFKYITKDFSCVYEDGVSTGNKDVFHWNGFESGVDKDMVAEMLPGVDTDDFKFALIS